ncbi:MAG: putative peptidoglycan glycosyltransferase FtsW [Candidatus Woesebacteria bacterium]|jgi:cell division protein FtsW
MRKKKKTTVSYQQIFLSLLTVLLSLIGLFFVFESSVAESFAKYSHPYHFLRQQSMWFMIGVALMFFTSLIPSKLWLKTAPLWYIFSLILLVLVFIPGIGLEINGAHRWIKIGPANGQPIEFVKFALVIFYASWMSKHQRLTPFLFLTAIPVLLLLLQPDMGSLLILLSIAFGMYYLSGGDFKKILAVSLAGVFFLALMILTSSYRLRRLKTFLNPEADPLGASFHIRQITLALGSGGWLGQGLGNSKQKFYYIPEASSDSIFAIIGEEIGFLGSMLLLLLFISYFNLIYEIALKAKNRSFAQLVAFGVLLWVSSQTLLNLAAVVALVPLTGLPLPFFSYGGSSLVMVFLATGVVLRIAKENRA